MNRGWLGFTSLSLLILITLWLILLIWDAAVYPSIESQAQAIAIGERLGWLFYLSYVNAVLFTLVTTALMAGLYVGSQRISPIWALVGLVVVPVYATLNLVVYASQITLVPALVEAASMGPSDAADLLLSWMVHLWPGSIMAMLNGLAYAVLGIPSILFGWIFVRHGHAATLAGILLGLSGAASIIGFAGMVVDSALLMLGTLVGGALFWLALFPLTWVLLRKA